MYYYRLYGLRVISDLKFPQLVEEQDTMPEAPAIYIQAGEIPEKIQNVTDRQYEFGETTGWLSNKTTWLFVENGEKITYSLKEGGNQIYLLTYILGYGMSMIAMQRGMLSIHCSALSDGKQAVLIAGESGTGKSTITAAFLERGYRLMADDMALVEIVDGRALAKPAFPYQKLCRDAALKQGCDLHELLYINEEKDKFLVPYNGMFDLQAVPIKTFIMLGITKGEEVMTRQITGLDRFHVFANNLFLRHLLGADKYKPAIGQKCLQMAAVVPTYCIGRPAGRDTVKQVLKEAICITEAAYE